MKKNSILLVALLFVGSTVFAQAAKSENLILDKNTIIPAEGVIMCDSYAAKEAKGKAPSGKDAIICQVKDEAGTKVYRWRIDFSAPYSIKTFKKIIVNWEGLDSDMAKTVNMNLSLFFLNKDDNKALRAKTFDMSKMDPTLTKKAILMHDNGSQPTTAEFKFSEDCRDWTGLTIDGSTKQVVSIEVYISGVTEGKGFAVTDVHFE